MKKKLIIIVMTFLMAIGLFVNISNAQTQGQLQRMAHNNIEEFLNDNIKFITNVSTDGFINRGEICRASMCMHHGSHGHGGNGTNMKTAVVDVGRLSVDSVESNGEFGYKNLKASDSYGAECAMKLLYLSSMCYQNRESSTFPGPAPYKCAMAYFASNYANYIKGEGLFNSGLDNEPGELTEMTNFILGPGGLQNHVTVRNMTAYTNAIKELKFADKSEKDEQTIKQVDDWVFIGPYKIENKGNNPSAGLDTYITSVQAIDKSGEKQYKPDGWASSIDFNSIHRWEAFKARRY